MDKQREKMKYRLADAMKVCMKKMPVENRERNRRSMWNDKTDLLPQFSG